MSESPDAGRRTLLGVGLVLIALYALGTAVPRDPDIDLLFGVEGYRTLGMPVFLIAAVLLLTLLVAPEPAARLGARAAGMLSRSPRWCRTAGVLALCGVGFWLLRNYALSGDAVTVVSRLAVGEVYPSNPLADYAFLCLGNALDLDPVRAVRLVSCLAGLAYAWCALGISRECFPRGARRVALATLLLSTGTVALFFGTIEVYAPLAAAIALYILLGLRWLAGKGSGAAPPLCLGLAFCLHGSAGLLLPSLILLANRGRFRPVAWGRGVRWAGLFLLPVAAVLLALYFGTWGGVLPEPGPRLHGTFFGAMDEGPVLPLLRGPENLTNRYVVFGFEHGVALLNLLAMLVPLSLPLLLVGRRDWGDPTFRFAAAAAVMLLVFPVFWNTNFGYRRDWDLFSTLGIPVALLGGLAFLRSGFGRAGAVRVAALALFALAPLVLGNHVDETRRYEYARSLGGRLHAAVPAAAGSEIARVAIRRGGERGLAAPDLTPREWRGLLGVVVARALAEADAFERREPSSRPPRAAAFNEGPVRLSLADLLPAFLGENHGAIDPDAWVEVLAEAAKATLDRGRAREHGDRWMLLLDSAREWRRVETSLKPEGYEAAIRQALGIRPGMRGYPEELESLARTMLHEVPNDARWNEFLAVAVYDGGRRAEGRELLRKAIRLDPERIAPRHRLFRMLLDEGEEERAVECLEQAIRLNACDTDVSFALLDLGWIRLERGEFDLAITAIEKAIYRIGQFQPGPEGEEMLGTAEVLLERARRRQPR